MRFISIISLLFLIACSAKLRTPIEFKFKDRNIEAVATFSKFSKGDGVFFGKMFIRNVSTDKRVIVDTVYLESGEKFIKIEPDYIADVMINVGRLKDSKYDIVAQNNYSNDEFRGFVMNIGYTLQNDTVPDYKLGIK